MSNKPIPRINEEGTAAIRQFRDDFKCYKIEDLAIDPPMEVKHTEMNWYSFHGSIVNRNMVFLFWVAGVPLLQDGDIRLVFEKADFQEIIKAATNVFDNIDRHPADAIVKLPEMINFYSTMDFLTTCRTVRSL